MTEQEGAKPQIITLPVELVEDYPAKLTEIITLLTTRKLKRLDIDLHALIEQLEPDQDNSSIRDWLADNDVAARPVFDRLMRKAARDRRIEADLGFLPRDELDLVRRYAEAHSIELTARGTINRNRSFTVGDAVIDARNKDTCPNTRLVYDVANAEGDNLDSLGRELRLLNARLDLGYRDSTISDALTAWQEEVTRQAKVDALMSIAFARGKATGPIGEAMWAAMERACFDADAHPAGFASAAIRKFMWQVKRKGRGLPITNHLMPVLTGAQGKGKTEFVKAMTAPLRDLMREVDFGVITDGKTTDIWSALILFIDEMGFFNRADVDQVKNIITSTERSIRVMRSNSSASIRNAATLIGCSNKSLAQLIRDETGGRRFAELVWSNTPDWEASNALDWQLLWQSVDETGPDPMLAMMDVLRSQQEENRNRHPIELWVDEHGRKFGTWTSCAVLHQTYRDWEREAFPRQDTNLSVFAKTLRNLCDTRPVFPFEWSKGRKGSTYRYAEKD